VKAPRFAGDRSLAGCHVSAVSYIDGRAEAKVTAYEHQQAGFADLGDALVLGTSLDGSMSVLVSAGTFRHTDLSILSLHDLSRGHDHRSHDPWID
jgi:hypothetical protein